MKKNLLTVIFLLSIGVFGYTINPGSGMEFNSEHWKTWVETEAECCIRWDMINSLKKQHKLIGMRSSEIIELLGDPDHESSNELSYFLGMARRGIDTGSLRLILDSSGSVDRYVVSRG